MLLTNWLRELSRGQTRIHSSRRKSPIQSPRYASHIENLENRRLLTNLTAVVTAGVLTITDPASGVAETNEFRIEYDNSTTPHLHIIGSAGTNTTINGVSDLDVTRELPAFNAIHILSNNNNNTVFISSANQGFSLSGGILLTGSINGGNSVSATGKNAYIFDSVNTIGNVTLDTTASATLNLSASTDVQLDLSSIANQQVNKSDTNLFLKLSSSAVSANMTVIGGSITNTLAAGLGDATLDVSASTGTNRLTTGSKGKYELKGGSGADTYVFLAPTGVSLTTVTEQANGGTDTLDFLGFTKGVIVDLNKNGTTDTTALGFSTSFRVYTTTAEEFENVEGGSGGDTITGNAKPNVLNGNGGKDILSGLGGSDTLAGGAENDTYVFVNATIAEVDTVIELDVPGKDLLDFTALTTAVVVDLSTPDNATKSIAAMTNRTVNTGLAGQAAHFENVNGGTAGDTITGNAKPNVLKGNGGDDVLSGLGGNDTLNGGDGNDTLNGNEGNDALSGDKGNDRYIFDAPIGVNIDTVTESTDPGKDTLDFSVFPVTSGLTVDLTKNGVTPNAASALASIKGSTSFYVYTTTAGEFENVDGGSGDDTITGNAKPNVLNGNGGNDVLSGLGGSDTLAGGADSDTYVFVNATSTEVDTVIELDVPGIDLLDFNALTTGVTVDLSIVNSATSPIASMTNRTVKTIANGQAAYFENVDGGTGGDTITGNAKPNVLNGGGGDDVISGLGGNDTLNGGDADDTLNGNEGNDALSGDKGNDRYIFDAPIGVNIDTVTESTDPGKDTLDFSVFPVTSGLTVDLTKDGATPNAASALASIKGSTSFYVYTTTAGEFENVNGGSGDDTITGNGKANVLNGNGGKDILSGLGGSDTLAGGADNDTYVFINATVAEVDTVIELNVPGIDLLDFSVLTTSVVVDLSTPNNAMKPLAFMANRTVNTDSAGQAANFENVNGGTAGDTITGNAKPNVLNGGGGNDVLSGLGGNDTLNGGDADDTLNGNEGNDALSGDNGNDYYIFDAPIGVNIDTVTESTDPGMDTLDFFAFTKGVIVDLNKNGTTDTTALGFSTSFRVYTTTAGEFENVKGGSGGDTITGNAKPNVLNGNGGNDVLSGMGGNDTLNGGDGNDTLNGNEGNDTLSGDQGSDRYIFDAPIGVNIDTVNESSDPGIDTLDFSLFPVTSGLTVDLTNNGVTPNAASALASIKGSTSFYVYTTTAGEFENVDGGSGGDTITGNAKSNVLNGNAGNDVLSGLGGSDTLAGGADSDTYVFVNATIEEVDTVIELDVPGIDLLDFTALTTAVVVDLSTPDNATKPIASMTNRMVNTGLAGQAANFENVDGGTAGDTITGNAKPNVLNGGGGDDVLSGLGGNDTLKGGDGDDTLNGNEGNDALSGEQGNDHYIFDAPISVNIDTITESTDPGIDTLDFSAFTKGLTVDLTKNGATPNAASALASIKDSTSFYVYTTTAGEFENVDGGSGDDTITGNRKANVLNGNGGDDFLSGLGGNDTLNGGYGDDWLNGNEGHDVLNGDNGNDTLNGNEGNDELSGGTGNDYYIFDAPIGVNLDTVTESTDSGIDTLDFSAFTKSVTVDLNKNGTTDATAMGVSTSFRLYTTTAEEFENVKGGKSDDTITGNKKANFIMGNGGNDIIHGGAGDTINGDAGNNFIKVEGFDGESGLTTIFGDNPQNANLGNNRIEVTGVVFNGSVMIDTGNSFLKPAGSSLPPGFSVFVESQTITGDLTIIGAKQTTTSTVGINNTAYVKSTNVKGNLSVDFGGGNDQYTQQLCTIEGDCWIDMGDGTNRVYISGQNFTATGPTKNLIKGKLTVLGGNGDDRVVIDNVTAEKEVVLDGGDEVGDVINEIGIDKSTLAEFSTYSQAQLVNPLAVKISRFSLQYGDFFPK